MTGLALALCAAVGVHLLVSPRPAPEPATPGTPGTPGTTPTAAAATVVSRLTALRARPRQIHDRAALALQRAGLDGVDPLQFAATATAFGLAAGALASVVVGVGVGSLLVAALAAWTPVAMWRSRRTAARRAAQEHWPRLIEELRVLVGPMGRPVPQALLEVGARGPVEMRPAFAAAQREWNLTTDFGRAVAVLKTRLADPTADAACETLLVVQEVGGELDHRLAALAEDRRRDLHDRKDADAKLAGARTARWFVVLVPVGMAVAGLNVGDGRDAFRTPLGQALVVVGIGLVAACWWWASRLMRLPVEERVFDR